MSTIFISYRRADSKHATSRINDRLRLEFGKNKVFKDVDSIPVGTDFRAVLSKVLRQCRVVLVMIGPVWTTATNPYGWRRLWDPNDFVRLELEAALARGIPVVPVLLDGASPPRPEELPPSVQAICFRHAISIGDDPHFDDDVARLIRSIRHLLEHKPAISTKPPKPERTTPIAKAEPELEDDAEVSEGVGLLGLLVSILAASIVFAQAGLSLLGMVELTKKGLPLGILCACAICATALINLSYFRSQLAVRRLVVAILPAITAGLIVWRFQAPGGTDEVGFLIGLGGCLFILMVTVWFVLTRPRRSS